MTGHNSVCASTSCGHCEKSSALRLLDSELFSLRVAVEFRNGSEILAKANLADELSHKAARHHDS